MEEILLKRSLLSMTAVVAADEFEVKKAVLEAVMKVTVRK